MMRARLALVCSCVLSLGSAARAASLLDDSPTMLAAWDAPLGFVSVVDNSFAPPSGAVTYRLLLSTGSNTDGNAPLAGPVFGQLGVSPADVGGHPGFDAGPAYEGSAVVRGFTASAGDIVTISYDFLTAEGAGAFSGLPDDVLSHLPTTYVDDFAFVSIFHDGITEVTRLADVVTPGMDDIYDASGERFLFHTGFRTINLTLPSSATGVYSIALCVMDGGWPLSLQRSGEVESALLVESINVTPGVNPVPSPAAASAGGVLLAGWASVHTLRRRRR